MSTLLTPICSRTHTNMCVKMLKNHKNKYLATTNNQGTVPYHSSN